MGTKGKTWTSRKSKPLFAGVLAYHRQHPKATLEAIGRKFGITRSGVWYIVHREAVNVKCRARQAALKQPGSD